MSPKFSTSKARTFLYVCTARPIKILPKCVHNMYKVMVHFREIHKKGKLSSYNWNTSFIWYNFDFLNKLQFYSKASGTCTGLDSHRWHCVKTKMVWRKAIYFGCKHSCFEGNFTISPVTISDRTSAMPSHVKHVLCINLLIIWNTHPKQKHLLPHC